MFESCLQRGHSQPPLTCYSMIAKSIYLYSRLIYSDIFKVKGCTAVAKKKKKSQFQAVFSKGKYFCRKIKMEIWYEWWNCVCCPMISVFMARPNGKQIHSHCWQMQSVTHSCFSYCISLPSMHENIYCKQSKLLSASVWGSFLLSYSMYLARHFSFCKTSTLFVCRVLQSVMKHYAGMAEVHTAYISDKKGMWTNCRLGNELPFSLIRDLHMKTSKWVVYGWGWYCVPCGYNYSHLQQ